MIYLDYAATTPIDPDVAAVLSRALLDPALLANPSSVHAAGRSSEAAVERAAEQLAGLLGCDAAEILWTSGATEADNLALFGAAAYRARHGRHIVSMRTEHKAVTDACRELARRGFELSWLEPDADGRVSAEQLAAALRDDTQLVSIMHVNNETGVVQDIAALGEVCRRHDVLFHVDAAQSAGKLPIDLGRLPVDLLSVSGHKMYGPKGIGALVLRRRAGNHLEPMLFGGGQQRGLRPGTLPVPLIVAFGAAAAKAIDCMEADLRHVTLLGERLRDGIAALDGCRRNGSATAGYPGILNVSAAGVDGESLLLALEPVCVSTGSACNSRDREPSYVLRALGRSDDEAQSAIRFSFGRFSTIDEIDAALERYRNAVTRLRALSPAA